MENKNYIAYLDILGTSSSASDPNLYKSKISEFVNQLTNSSGLLGQGSNMHYFSDCAYIQANKLDKLILFLMTLRENLMLTGVYFTAAVKKGQLNPRPNQHKTTRTCNIQGVSFSGEDIAILYSFHNQFKGAGICLDKEIVNELKCIDDWDNYIVESYFIPELGRRNEEDKFVLYHDVIFNPIHNNNVFEMMVRKALNDAILAGSQNPRFGRNYIPLMITLMKSRTHINIEWNKYNHSLEKASILWCIIYKFSINTDKSPVLFGIEYLSLVLLDLLYTESPNNYLDDDDRKDATIQILRKGVLSKKYNSVGEMPKEFFNENNTKWILQDYLDSATSEFLDN